MHCIENPHCDVACMPASCIVGNILAAVSESARHLLVKITVDLVIGRLHGSRIGAGHQHSAAQTAAAGGAVRIPAPRRHPIHLCLPAHSWSGTADLHGIWSGL